MTDHNYCHKHEYHYVGSECPMCRGMCDCCPGPVCSATAGVEDYSIGFAPYSGDTEEFTVVGGCQAPDRGTFVELATDPELARIEREFHESRERLERLIRDAVQSAVESTFGVDRSVQVWTEDSRFYQFTEDLTDHLVANIEGEMSDA